MAGDFGFLKGNIETIILNALYSGDKYGYEIAKEIKERTENQYEIKQPTLYSYLKRLESNNLITSYWGAESNGGRRRYYKLTEQGRRDCERFSAEWKYHKSVLDTLVDTDGNYLPDLTQDEVTPLFGTKSKRTRKSKGVSVDDYDEQELIAKKLAEINKAKEEEQQQVADSQATEQTATTTTQPEKEENVVEHVEEQLHEENVEQEKVVETQSDFHESSTNYEQVTIFTDEQAEEISNQANEAAEEREEIVTDVAYEDVSEKLHEQETHDTAATSSDTVQTQAEQQSTTAESEKEESQQEIHERFEVRQDDADDFMAKFDEKISAMSQQHRRDEDDDIDYQNVLLNVMGKQLNEMENFNNSNPDERYDYTCERPLALEDVADEFAKDGIRMRIYNRTTAVYRPKKLLPLNKIYCQTAWISYAIVALLLGIMLLATRTFAYWIPYVVVTAVLIVAPLVFTFYFMSDPSRKNQPVLNFKHLLIVCAAVALIVCLFAFGINILFFDLKFAYAGPVATQVGIPIILGLTPLIVVAILKVCMTYQSK